MTLLELKKTLGLLDNLSFQLPDGQFIPSHFHLTEFGEITRNFIDCGGKVRQESKVNFQLWTAEDIDHRLSPSKLLEIIQQSEHILKLKNATIEVEYQTQTVGKYGLMFNGQNLVLTNTYTDCLARNKCSVRPEKPKVRVGQSGVISSCDANSNCC